MFFYFVFSVLVSPCFTFQNIEIDDISNDNYSIRNIITSLNLNYKFSHVAIICQNRTEFCTQFSTHLQQNFIPVSIFKLENNSLVSLGKLNVLHFNSENILLDFILKNYLNWNSNQYYVIFLKNGQASEILYTLWSKFKIRRAVMFDTVDSYDGSVYDIVANCTKKINAKNSITQDLFKLKNFQGTPLRAALFKRVPEMMKIDNELLGINYRFLELLSQKLNFTSVIKQSSDGMKFGSYIHGKYTGSMAEVVYGKSDIACNGFFIQKTHTDEYKYLFPISMDYVCLLVPKAGKIPKYMAPFKCFPEEVWFAMMLTFTSVGLVRYFIHYVHRVHLKWKENSNILLNLFSVAINMPILFSQYKYLSSRIILIIFLSQMYVIVTSFQGSLVMLLSVPKFYKDIDTMAELNRTNMEIKVGSSGLINVIKQDSTLKALAKKVKRVKDDDFRNFNFAFFARFIHHKQKVLRTFSIKKENRSIIVHRIEECPLKYYTSFIVAWNFPFIEEFNEIMGRIVESGLMSKWVTEIDFKLVKDLKPEIRTKHGDEQMENKIFTLNDLEVAFIVLIVGYCFSFSIFIREIIKSKRT